MTRAEAIKYLKEMRDKCNDTCHKVRYVTHEEALDVAIKALSQEQTDAISRDIALVKMSDYVASGYAESVQDFEEYTKIICQLPSVTVRQSELKPFTEEHHKVYMEGWNDGRKKLLEAMEREIAY